MYLITLYELCNLIFTTTHFEDENWSSEGLSKFHKHRLCVVESEFKPRWSDSVGHSVSLRKVKFPLESLKGEPGGARALPCLSQVLGGTMQKPQALTMGCAEAGSGCQGTSSRRNKQTSGWAPQVNTKRGPEKWKGRMKKAREKILRQSTVENSKMGRRGREGRFPWSGWRTSFPRRGF